MTHTGDTVHDAAQDRRRVDGHPQVVLPLQVHTVNNFDELPSSNLGVTRLVGMCESDINQY